jgi:hypothetical protein
MFALARPNERGPELFSVFHWWYHGHGLPKHSMASLRSSLIWRLGMVEGGRAVLFGHAYQKRPL